MKMKTVKYKLKKPYTNPTHNFFGISFYLNKKTESDNFYFQNLGLMQFYLNDLTLLMMLHHHKKRIKHLDS